MSKNHEHDHEHEHEHHHDHEHEHSSCGGCGCSCCHEHGGGHEEEAQPLWLIFLRIGVGAAFCAGAVFCLEGFWKILLFALGFLVVGYDTLWSALRDIFSGHPFGEGLLMTLASLAAFAIGEYLEAVAVMVLYMVGELLQDRAVDKSRDAVRSLLDSRPEEVVLERDGKAVTVPTAEVQPGDVLIVGAGERIPVDGVILSGHTTVDTSALTGESLPQEKGEGDEVIGGFINLTGGLKVRAKCAEADSAFSRILEIVEESTERKSRTQNFLTRFCRIYTPAVVGLTVLTVVIPLILYGTGNLSSYLYRAAVLLSISCPCALVISVPVGFFGGIGGASRRGILFKGANFLDRMGSADLVVCDKTGTLTTGAFSVRELCPEAGVDEQELLTLSAAAEAASEHPLARALRAAAGDLPLAEDLTQIPGRGVSALVNGRRILCGNAAFLQENSIAFEERPASQVVLYTACDNRYLGAILLGDTVKPGAREAIAELKALGVRRVEILTGDTPQAAEEVARTVGADGVRASLLPQDKVAAFEELKKASRTAIFVGDGINDAPVLARADVGVAMGGLGSDAAVEAADVVIMDDDLKKLASGMRASRRTKRIVTENIVLAIAVKLTVLILGLFGQMWLWLALVADTGVALLAVLNSLRALRQK